MRIGIADDHIFVQESLALLLSVEDRHQVVAAVGSVPELRELLALESLDLLLLDYNMPGGDSYAVAQQLKSSYPALKIIVLTAVASPLVLDRLAHSDIDGLVLKTGTSKEILKAIALVEQGERYISPLVEEQLEQLQVKLTARELQILVLIVQGVGRAEIAKQLHVSVETVKTHRRNLMHKLDVTSSAELIQQTSSLGLLE